MRLRLLLALGGPLAAAVYFLHYNRGLIDLRLSEGWSVRLPLALVFGAAVLLGALAAALLGWGEAGLGAFSRWRLRRRERRKERARESLAQARRMRGQGSLRRARRLARRAIRQDPGLQPALTFAGELAAEAGDLDEAIRWNERLRTLAPDSHEAIVRLSENLEASGRAAEAEKLLSQAGGNGKAHPAILRRLRDFLAETGRWEEALAACERLARLGAVPSEREADERSAGRILLAAAEARLSAADARGAASLLEEAVRRLPSEAAPRLRLGDAYVSAGRARRALRAWEAGYRELGEPEFLRRMVTSHKPLETEGALRQAASALISAGRARPRDPVPRLMASALLLEAGRTEEAVRWLREASDAASASDGEPGWVSLVARLLEARGKLEAGDRLAAESAFRKVAQEAGRLLLGESPSGIVIRPFDIRAGGGD